MDEEFRFHLEMEAERYLRSGLDPAEARRRALLAFGGVEWYRERLRDERRFPFLEPVRDDVRAGVRSMARTPGLSLLAALTIALGVGATTTMFSTVNALFVRPLAIPDAERLASIQEARSGAVSNGMEGMLIPYDRYIAYRDATVDIFDALAAHRLVDAFSLRLRDETIAVNGALTSGNFFQTLGVRPVIGRAYASDDAAEIVISHELWASRFGGDPEVVGRAVGLDGRTVTVVGIAPRGFGGATVVSDQVWAPVGIRGVSGTSWSVRMVPLAKLRPGVSTEQAALVVDALARRIPPGEDATVRSAHLARLTVVPSHARSGVRTFFAILMGMAILVLLIAAANIAGIMLARGFARRRELAVRLAIGASRGRIVRHLLAESLTLFAAGGMLGVALAYLGTRWIAGIDLPPQMPPVLLDLAPDGRVLLFAIAVTGVTGLVFGLVPALQASRPELVSALKKGSSGSVGSASRVRNVFVAGQVALAVTLLLTATLFARSLQKGLATDIGFEPNGLVVATINLGPPLDYDRERAQVFQRALRERVRTLPGVESVAFSQYVLLSGSRSGGGYRPADAPADASVHAAYSSITPTYFETMGIRLVAGRAFTDADADDAAPVVIINQTLADRLWPDQNAVGRMLLGPIGDTPAEVVGVTRAGRYVFITEQPAAYVFYPYYQVHRAQMAIHVRATGAEPATLRALVDEVRILEPDVALGMPARLAELVDVGLLPHRWAALFVGGLGVVGLVLAALGIYGVLASEVTGRTREFGVRRALGATRARVIASVVRRGALLAGIGCAAGAALGAGAGIAMESLLFGIRPLDAVTFTAVPIVLFGVALLASWLPASRASDVEPSEALRSE